MSPAVQDNFEYAVVGAFLNDPTLEVEKLRESVATHGLKAEHFCNHVLGRMLEALNAHESLDKNILCDDISRHFREHIREVEKAIENAPCCLSDAEYEIKRLVEDALKRRVEGDLHALFAQRDDYTPESYAVALQEIVTRNREIARTTGTHAKDEDAISFGDFMDSMRQKDFSDTYILNKRWLKRGGSLMLVSTSGAGKSVITMQFATAWAAGRACFGIGPERPLKIGLYQTEDDEEEMKDFGKSMCAGNPLYVPSWTQEHTALVAKNLELIPVPVGVRGKKFIQYLTEVQQRRRYDLVILNPFTAIADINLSDNTEVGKFLREELDVFNKTTDPAPALMIVHHTGKPPTGGSGNSSAAREPSDINAEYTGLGAADLTGWARAKLHIEKVHKRPGVFRLVATKRHESLGAGWQVEPGKTYPSILIRHHDPALDGDDGALYYWHKVEEAADAAAASGLEGSAATAPDPKARARADAKALVDALQGQTLNRTKIRNAANAKFGSKRGGEACTYLTNHLEEFELREVSGATPAERNITFPAQSSPKPDSPNFS